jgi:hypothetical protein
MQPEFTKHMITKAEKFLELGLIRYEGHGVWLVSPILGYNTSTHRVRSHGEFGFACDCQGYTIKEAKYKNLSSSIYPVCSHIGAVKLFEQRRRQKERFDLNQNTFEFATRASV